MTFFKATPDQWANAGSCVRELRARVEALERTQHTHPEQPDAEPAPPEATGESEYSDQEWQEIQRWQKLDDRSPAPPTGEPPEEISGMELCRIWNDSKDPGEQSVNAMRRIYRAGWDAAMAAIANHTTQGGNNG